MKLCISSIPLVSAVNHTATRNLSEKIKTLTKESFFSQILMSTLTWITEKELEREINNNGDKFRLACVASVFARVRLESWDKSKKKKKKKLMTGEGEGKERNACPQTPRF